MSGGVDVRAKIYEVRDAQTDELLAAGSAIECARELGIHPDTVRYNALGRAKSKRYSISEVSEGPALPPSFVAPRAVDKHDLAAQWDAFCEPIRKKYGIPVYKAPPCRG